MARKREFNLSETIREFQKGKPGGSAREAFESISKEFPTQKIKEGTFKSTFYKLAGSKRRAVKRRKPGAGSSGARRMAGRDSGSDAVMRAGLTFIRLAGGVDQAREHLAGLKELIETARAI